LSAQESDQLIEQLLGGSQVASDTRARIREVAEGNPLFVEQLLAMLAEGGDPGDVPPSMHALLAARLEALPDDERDVLERASVAGLEVEWEALAALADDARPSGTLLAALVRKELIRPHEAIGDTFCFRHILIRDAAYERISKELRSELHERFADWLDSRGEEVEEIVGYHLEQGYRWVAELGPIDHRARGLAVRAGERLASSGRRAHARGDTSAAVNLLERASLVLAVDDGRRLNLLPLLGRAMCDAGRMEQAESVFSEAIERGQAAGIRPVAADAAIALADRQFHQHKIGREDVLRELESAVRAFEESGDKAGLARALSLRGKLRFWAGEAAAALDELERAAQHAREAGDGAQEADSLHYVLVATFYGPTPIGEALARAEEMRPRAQGNRRVEVNRLQSQARFEAMQGGSRPRATGSHGRPHSRRITGSRFCSCPTSPSRRDASSCSQEMPSPRSVSSVRPARGSRGSGSWASWRALCPCSSTPSSFRDATKKRCS
jgi:tetratricopeptide (TPR) repeat protein